MNKGKPLGVASFVLFALSICLLVAHAQKRMPSQKVWPGQDHINQSTGVYNVRNFGAKGDGKSLDSIAINQAIETAASHGGGTIHFPAGSYLSVSIHLKSNISLYLDQGATIVAAETSKGVNYDPPEPNQWEAYEDFGHAHWHNSLIWGENLEDIAILGPGKIFGRGLSRGFGRGLRDQLPEERKAGTAAPGRPATPPPEAAGLKRGPHGL